MNLSDEFERRVRLGEQRYRVIFDSTYDGMLVVLAETYVFLDVNARMCAMFGYSHGQMLDLDFQRLSSGAAPTMLIDRNALRDRTPFGEAVVFEWSCRGRDGNSFWTEVAARRADFDGRDVLLLTLRDTTLRRTAMDALAERDGLLAALTLSVAEIVISPTKDTKMSKVLEAFGEALNVDRIVVVEGLLLDLMRDGALRYTWKKSERVQPIDAIASPAARIGEIEQWLAPLLEGQPVIASAQTATGVAAQAMRNLGSLASIQMPFSVLGAYWGRIIVDDCTQLRAWTPIEIDALHILARIIGADISRERGQAQLLHLARFDELTGLPNRRLFIELLEKEIGRVARAGPRFGVLLLNLDRFRDVDDTLGGFVGDALLKLVGDRLTAAVRPFDTSARLGADDFAVIRVDASDPNDIAILADTLVAVLSKPYVVDGHHVRVTASLGVAYYGPDSSDSQTMLSHAHVALVRAKADGGKCYRFFTDAMDREMRERVELEKDLGEAVLANQFFVEYQPQVDMRTNALVGLEALVRWQHPARGTIDPGTFIPAAERTGLIVSIGNFVLRETCLQVARWIDAGVAPPVVAVNVSVVQFKAARAFPTVLAAILSETGVGAERIELELTESVIMEASRDCNGTLVTLRQMGCRVAIDDFGDGYSSLDYLRRFHVDRIKIPQNFTRELCTEPNDALIVRSSLDLAHALGIDVVVEGVETAEQRDCLTSWGCRFAQGFYYAKPLSAADATALLRIGHVVPGPLTPLALAP